MYEQLDELLQPGRLLSFLKAHSDEFDVRVDTNGKVMHFTYATAVSAPGSASANQTGERCCQEPEEGGSCKTC